MSDGFLLAAADDPCIGPTHICMYMVLHYFFQQAGHEDSFIIRCDEVMHMMKIRSRRTYHRVIRQLHERGYIVYLPSHKIGETRVRMNVIC